MIQSLESHRELPVRPSAEQAVNPAIAGVR
jgi:hypothetical protein